VEAVSNTSRTVFVAGCGWMVRAWGLQINAYGSTSKGVVQEAEESKASGMNTTPEIAQATADLLRSLAHLVQAIMAHNTDQTGRPTTEDRRLRSPVRLKNCQLTTEPIQPGETSGVLPEFGRWADVQRLFGIKRGTLYNLLADG
jgi:hypothetical protein